MVKKAKRGKESDSEGDLWIAPRHSLKGPAGERAWDSRRGGGPSNNKFLELADLAFGLKKPQPKKQKVGVKDETSKKEPYSN